MSAEHRAIFAGGCFWGMQDLFRRHPGVLRTRVGYTGGALEDPAYEDIRTGATGHAEALEVIFDPELTSYETLVKFFFQLHDPTTKNRQGNDVGSQYRSAIFFLDAEQEQTAHQVMEALDKAGIYAAPIQTEVVPFSVFYEAEAFHQDYLERNPGGYTCHWVRPDWVLKS